MTTESVRTLAERCTSAYREGRLSWAQRVHDNPHAPADLDSPVALTLAGLWQRGRAATSPVADVPDVVLFGDRADDEDPADDRWRDRW